MTTYEVPSKLGPARPFRVFGLLATLFLLALLALSKWNPDWLTGPLRQQLGYSAFAVLILMLIGSFLLGGKTGRWKWKRTFHVELGNDKIVLRRAERPDVEIPLADIRSVEEASDWLVLRGGQPLRGMAIPREITDYESLRQEIARHHPIEQRKRGRFRSLVLPTVPTVIGVLALYLCFTSRSSWIRGASGAVLCLWFVWGFFFLLRMIQKRGEAVWILLVYVLSWLCLAWFLLRTAVH